MTTEENNLPDLTGWDTPLERVKPLPKQNTLFDPGPDKRQCRGRRGIDPWQLFLFPEEDPPPMIRPRLVQQVESLPSGRQVVMESYSYEPEEDPSQ